MTHEGRIQERIEDILDSDCTPEEICKDCLDLLPEVRRRWQRLRRVEGQIDELFPLLSSTLEESGPTTLFAETKLPQIEDCDVQAFLGRGGMGVVYKARHLKLNRAVALKMLLAGPYAAPHERARFFCEAEAVAGLQHPHIVQVHEIDELEGRPYFTMELIEGGAGCFMSWRSGR